MELWASNFVWIALGTALVAWFLVGQIWQTNSPIWKNASTTCFYAVVVLTAFGAAASLFAHLFSLGAVHVFHAVFSDLIGGSAYFLETGLETSALWIPAVLMRVALLSIGDFLRGTIETE